MRIAEILSTQAVRFFKVGTLAPKDQPHILDVVRAIETKYKFLQAPRVLKDYDLNAGVTFLSGTYDGNLPIDKLQLYGSGALCESRTRSSDIDAFLDDLVVWTKETFGIAPALTGAKAYQSNLVVVSDTDIGLGFKKFAVLGLAISSALRSYGQNPLDFQVSQVALHCDILSVPIPRPSAFLFARRDGSTYAENLYFSAAPLTTSDHVETLNTLEQLLSS